MGFEVRLSDMNLGYLLNDLRFDNNIWFAILPWLS